MDRSNRKRRQSEKEREIRFNQIMLLLKYREIMQSLPRTPDVSFWDDSDNLQVRARDLIEQWADGLVDDDDEVSPETRRLLREYCELIDKVVALEFEEQKD